MERKVINCVPLFRRIRKAVRTLERDTKISQRIASKPGLARTVSLRDGGYYTVEQDDLILFCPAITDQAAVFTKNKQSPEDHMDLLKSRGHLKLFKSKTKVSQTG